MYRVIFFLMFYSVGCYELPRVQGFEVFDDVAQGNQTAQMESLPVSHRLQRSARTNSIATLHRQLDPLARITNALYLSSLLTNSPKNADDVINKLLNTDDKTILKSLKDLNVDSLTATVQKYATAPLPFKDDRKEVFKAMETLVELRKRHSALKSLEDAKIRKSFTDELSSLKDFNLPVLNTKDKNEIDDELEYLLKGDGLFHRINREFDLSSRYVQNVESFVKSTLDFNSSAFDNVVSNIGIVENLWKWSEFFEVYERGKSSFSNLTSSLAENVKSIQNIANNAPNETTMKELSAFDDFITKLGASNEPTIRKYTPGFPSGIRDVEMIHDDLANAWILKTFGSRGADFLESALAPLLSCTAHVNQLEIKLRNVVNKGGMVKSVAVFHDMLNEMTQLEKDSNALDASEKAVELTIKHANGIEPVDSNKIASVRAKLAELLSHLIRLKELLRELSKDDDFKSLGDLSILKQALSLSDNATIYEKKAKVKYLRENATLSETADKIKKHGAAITEIGFLVGEIKVAMSKVDYLINTIKSAGSDCENAQQELVEFLTELQKNHIIGPLKTGLGIAAKLRTLSIDRSVYKDTHKVLSDISSSANKLSSIRSSLDALSKRVEGNSASKAIGKFADVEKTSRVIGAGSVLLGELEKVVAKRKDLETLVKNADAVGQQIEQVKNDQVKLDIRKGWGDKTKSSVSTLLKEVDAFEKNIPTTGAADLGSVSAYLTKAKAVHDPAINVEEARKSVALLNEAVSSDPVSETNAALWRLDDLDLQFASLSAPLTNIPDSIDTLTKFLNGLPEEQRSKSGSETNQVQDRTYMVLFYIVLPILLLALVVIVYLLVHLFKNYRKGSDEKEKEDLKKKETGQQAPPVLMAPPPPARQMRTQPKDYEDEDGSNMVKPMSLRTYANKSLEEKKRWLVERERAKKLQQDSDTRTETIESVGYNGTGDTGGSEMLDTRSGLLSTNGQNTTGATSTTQIEPEPRKTRHQPMKKKNYKKC